MRKVVDLGPKRPTVLRVLNLEDSALDTELMQANLAKGGIDCEMVRVQTRADFVAALEDGGFDLILADYAVPSIDGLLALELARGVRPEVPFILVSGTVDEDLAIEIMRRGATDYVLKHRLERLVPAVMRATREAEERRERTRAEEALRQSEERFRATFEQAAVGLAHVGLDGRWLRVNHKLCDILGYSCQELLQKTSQQITHPDDLASTLGYTEQLLAGEIGSFSIEMRYLKKDGSIIWGNLTVSLVREPSGEPGYGIAVIEDITERKRTEEALRASEERYRAVVEQSTEGIYVLDAETKRILETNPSLQQMLGYTADELDGMEIYDLIAHPREDVDANHGRALKEGRHFVGERKYRRKDGSLVEVEVGVCAIRCGGRKVVCAVVRDITERKRTEETLREVREAERNRIARDLHDDILQDIVYALQEIQIMQVTSGNGTDAALGDTAEALRRSVEGLRGAVFELRLKEGLGRSFVSALESLVDLNRRMARNRYELQLDVEDGFPPTLSERASQELTRIIQEALTNARRHSEARRVEVRLWLAGDLACAEVADDGRGFDAALSGIGMGQHSMRHRALELGGDLQVESEPGRGTRVRFHAPLSRLVET